jgi:hypothetical protein
MLRWTAAMRKKRSFPDGLANGPNRPEAGIAVRCAKGKKCTRLRSFLSEGSRASG